MNKEEYIPRLLEFFGKQVTPAMSKEFSYSNRYQCPSIVKVVLNMGSGLHGTITVRNAKKLITRKGKGMVYGANGIQTDKC